MKKLIALLLTIGIIGCSSEIDSRFICECLYYQDEPDDPFKSKKKFNCQDDEITTLTINFKNKTFDVDKMYLGDTSKFIFDDHKIHTRQFNSEIFYAFEFNRISLLLEYSSGLIDTTDFDPKDSLDVAFPSFTRFGRYGYQCEITQGI
tara:strand:+ start:161 stop:604 length:444 start_codon:yes stop_codon:yes gene_type:complete